MVATREQSGGEMTCEKPGLPAPLRSARERFLHSGLRNFRAGALIEKSGASAQSVDQDPEPGIWNLEGPERAALPHYSNSQLLTPSFSTPPFASEVYPDDLIYSCDIGMPLCLGGGNPLLFIDHCPLVIERSADPSGHVTQPPQPPPKPVYHPPQHSSTDNTKANAKPTSPPAAHGSTSSAERGQPTAGGKSASGHADGVAGHDHAHQGRASLNNRVANALQSKNPVMAFKKDPALAAEILRQLEKGMPPGGISYLELHANREIMYALNQASRGRGLDLAHLKFFLRIIREEEHGQGGHAFNLMVTPQDIHQILSWYANSQKGFAGAVNAVMDKPGVSDIAMGLIAIGGGAVGGLDDSGGSSIAVTGDVRSADAAKQMARDLMANRAAAESLPPIKPPEEHLQKYGGDYEEVLQAVKRTNPSVNAAIEARRELGEH